MAAVEDEQPSSSTSTFSKDEVNKLMSEGKRHFVCNEIVEAVKSFEVACLMLNNKYGALSNECGDAHFHYGKSLLELARLESGVLGSAIKEAVDEELPDDYDEDASMETGEGGTSAGATAAESSSTMTEDNADSQSKVNEETSAKESEEKVEGSTEEKMEEDETESKTDENMPDDKKDMKGEEKAGPSEEKPACESVEEKMVEETIEESKVEDKSSDNKDKTEKIQQKNDNKDVSKDTNKVDKEITSEEDKEIDETVGENGDQKKPEQNVGEDENKTDEQNVEDGQNKTTEEQPKNVVEDGENKTTEQQKESVDSDGDVNVDEDVNDEQTTDDGPVSTIQLAWETLELARIIFKRHNNTEMQLKLAQTHLLLGEIHMEQEQFSDAVSELTKCLNIQKNLLKPDDRLLAETYYNLGLAYTLSMMYEESANHYGNATEVLELRLKNIKNRIEEAEQQDKGKGKASDDDPLVKDRKELAELEDLLPEVKEKCLDAKNENERLKINIKEKLGLTSAGAESSSFSTCSTSCSDKPVSDISHLVRKKRKPKDDETTENIEAPAKKQRQEGENTTTQPENGDSTLAKTNGDEPQS